MRALLALAMLYIFLVGVALLEVGIAGLGEDFTTRLLGRVANPLSGLFVGLLFTVLVQSSSVSTSAIVGLVGAGTIPLELAVPMVMGANIGTTVTNTLAALGNIRRPNEFRLGFAAATLHDYFKLLSVAILLPLEMATGILVRMSTWLTGILRGSEVSEIGTSPIRSAVRVPVGMVQDLLGALPLSSVLVAVILLGLGLGAIFAALGALTKNMRALAAGGVEQVMNNLIGKGGGTMGILVGILVTVAVQSSSITTAMMVPMVAAGLLTLRSAYPVTLGANIGTTITALLASLAVLRPEGLTIALVHTLFNLLAILIIYPIPFIRDLPVKAAVWTADVATKRTSLVLVYVLGLFIVLPALGVFILG
ncbi:MAG: sodium dependent phosphate transporter [Gemmatimonadales bacterium]|nr:MAG: sodium dependent phosphate transporter [Gemmatimonadales bacterium]